MGTLVLVADRETTHGARQALDVLASFRKAPIFPVVGKRPVTLLQLEGGVYKRRPGAIFFEKCECGRADCAVEALGGIWAELDQTALGCAGDVQTWLAFRAYQIARDACHNGERVDLAMDEERQRERLMQRTLQRLRLLMAARDLPDLTEHAAVCS